MGRRRPRAHIAAAVVAALLLAGCASDDDGGAGGPTRTTTRRTLSPPTTVDPLTRILAEIRESTPQAIAEDLSLSLSLRRPSDGDVTALADRLCASAYDPGVVQRWLADRRAAESLLLLKPTARLLRLAERRCKTAATPGQRSRYDKAMVAAYLDLPDQLETTPEEAANKKICDLLGSKPGGDAVSFVVDKIVEIATRGRVRDSEVLGLMVDAATNTCPAWLPAVRGSAGRLGS